MAEASPTLESGKLGLCSIHLPAIPFLLSPPLPVPTLTAQKNLKQPLGRALGYPMKCFIVAAQRRSSGRTTPSHSGKSDGGSSAAGHTEGAERGEKENWAQSTRRVQEGVKGPLKVNWKTNLAGRRRSQLSKSSTRQMQEGKPTELRNSTPQGDRSAAPFGTFRCLLGVFRT